MRALYPSSNAVAVKDPSEDKPLKLYVRLSAWLVPSFLVCAIIGLTALSKFVVADVDRNLSMRIGNFAARVASGIEMIALDTDDPIPASQQLLLTLMSDPAVECAELRDIDGTPLVKAPQNLGCYEGVSPRFLTVPLYLTDEADLVVHWNREEVSTARQRQWELSLIILFAGLMIAMLTNWLAFRTIIGRPLTNLVQKVEDAKRKAEYNALHDSLTNLANRRQLDYELERRGAQRQALTILHIDLDGFKTINDTLGHGAGDEILKVVSERLKDTAWVDEITGRYGGDEFVVILPPGETTEAGETRATQIIDSIMEEIIVDGQACQVGASIGIASGNPNGRPDQASRILANADIALYRAKDKGRGVYVVYSSEMREEMEMRNRLADELETALEQREFVPFYQPQVEADGHKTIGFEALARWEHPKHGLLAPDRFISAAEDMGLVDKIDRIIFEKVLEDRANWL
ncbi:MAG: diguanylate cyclase, partial [Pseudomonadota bacterium]